MPLEFLELCVKSWAYVLWCFVSIAAGSTTLAGPLPVVRKEYVRWFNSHSLEIKAKYDAVLSAYQAGLCESHFEYRNGNYSPGLAARMLNKYRYDYLDTTYVNPASREPRYMYTRIYSKKIKRINLETVAQATSSYIDYLVYMDQIYAVDEAIYEDIGVGANGEINIGTRYYEKNITFDSAANMATIHIDAHRGFEYLCTFFGAEVSGGGKLCKMQYNKFVKIIVVNK